MPDRPRCPTCGQTMPHADTFLSLRFSPQQAKVLELIRRAGDNGITTESLILAAYRGSREPDHAARVIWVTIWRLNLRLRPLGFTIRNASHLEGYTLRQLST